MRSLILLVVEHGETTDGLDQIIRKAQDPVASAVYQYEVTDYSVRVDIPACFKP